MATAEADVVLERATAQRDRLLKRLAKQRNHTIEMLAWYTGVQQAPGLPKSHTNQFWQRLRDTSRNAWGRLIVDAIAERLEVQGYRSTQGDATSKAAWTMLQANRIDSDQRQVHTEALIASVAYVLVTGSGSVPVITPETPLEVTHEWEPGSRRTVRGALKVFPLDDLERVWRAELYTPDFLFVWLAELGENTTPFNAAGGNLVGSAAWFLDDAAPNPLTVVPVVPFENRPLPSTGPLSELKDLVDVFCRIDELTVDKQIAAHFGAFRQRWATGLELETDDQGNKVEPYKASQERLWISEDEATKFGTFEATQLDGYIKAIDAEVAELAAISRVPAHYLMSQNLANPPSAESLVASESGLVQKVRDRQRGFGESWEQVVRLAMRVAGDEQAAGDLSSEIQWRDPQVRHPAQVADAAVKYDTVGVPREAIWHFLGASPQEIDQWRTLAASDQLLAAAFAPAPAPAPAPPGPPANAGA